MEVLRGILVGTDPAAGADAAGDPSWVDLPSSPAGASPDPREVEGFLLRHGLAGLALACCRRAEERGLPPPLPDAVRRALEPHRIRAALESRVRLDALDRARRVLRAAGISSLAFKGAALLLDGTYRDVGERTFEDVDLLVRPGDAEAAVHALMRRDFRPWTPWDASRTGWVSAFTLDDGEAPPDPGATVDLHWSATYGPLRLPSAEGPDPLWEGADLDPGLPGTEAHFVVLAAHFLKHLRVVPHLRGLGDLCRLAPRLVDVDVLLGHARRRGSRRSLATILRTLARLWGVDVPREVMTAVGADGPPTAAERRYLAPGPLLGASPVPRSRLSGLVLRWRLGGGAAAAIRDLAQVAAPPAPWLRARYPQARPSSPGLRVRYGLALVGWAVGLGRSPLSPNQDTGVDIRAGPTRSDPLDDI